MVTNQAVISDPKMITINTASDTVVKFVPRNPDNSICDCTGFDHTALLYYGPANMGLSNQPALSVAANIVADATGVQISIPQATGLGAFITAFGLAGKYALHLVDSASNTLEAAAGSYTFNSPLGAL